MEMPVVCPMCNECIELHDTRQSDLTGDLLCEDCCQKDNEVAELKEEIETICLDLENHAEYMVGDRRGWKKKLNELKERMKSLGYDYDLMY